MTVHDRIPGTPRARCGYEWDMEGIVPNPEYHPSQITCSICRRQRVEDLVKSILDRTDKHMRRHGNEPGYGDYLRALSDHSYAELTKLGENIYDEAADLIEEKGWWSSNHEQDEGLCISNAVFRAARKTIGG